MNKGILILILLILAMFSMSCIYASDVNDTLVASEDTAAIEVAQIDDIAAGDTSQAIEQSNDEEIISEGNVGTFSELQNNITAKYGGTLELDGNYEYDEGFDSGGIKIEQKITIDGKGHTIDAKGKSRVFNVQASDVTIKNLNIKNANYHRNGGAVYFAQSGSVINCNFTDNHVNVEGGAVWMNYGNVINSMFIGNSAPESGAILSNQWCGIIVDTCIFKTDSDTTKNVDIHPPTLNVDNFTTSYGSCEKLTFDLKTNSNMSVDDGNISISVYYKNNDSWFGNYSCLSGKGWTVDLPAGSYYAVFNTEYAGFEPINRTITVSKFKTSLTVKAVTATYNINKNLIITLKDAKGNALTGASVTVDLNGAKTYVTDKNGQITINVAKLVPKAYTAKITFAGNSKYMASSANVKVTVKKAKSIIVAKKKTFKKAKKIKKYTITLKSGKTAIKKVWVTLKIKGKKIIKAKTNKKGKVVFKIKKLTKKGKYKVTIKFKGNKYYKAVTKKVKIRIK